jgi:hypothetical protein
MTSPRFEYDGRTDGPRPPLRNSTPLLLLMGLGGLFLVLLVTGELVALFVAQRTADSATGKVDSTTPVALWDGAVVGDQPAGRGRVPFLPDRHGRPGPADVVGGPDAGGPLGTSAATDRARK